MRTRPAAGKAGARCRGPSCLDPAAHPADELAGRSLRAAHHRGDLAKGDIEIENVVKNERQPPGGGQDVEHHQQRQPGRVGRQRLLLRVSPIRAADPGSGLRAE